jgi:hypothetical protein
MAARKIKEKINAKVNYEVDGKENDKCCGGKQCCGHGHHAYHHGCGGAVYGLGFLGAAIYFIGHATSFWSGVLGVLKAIIWPTFAVFGLFKFLGL